MKLKINKILKKQAYYLMKMDSVTHVYITNIKKKLIGKKEKINCVICFQNIEKMMDLMIV